MTGNRLSQDLFAAGESVQYDAQVKTVLRNKIVLAWILHYTAEPFGQLQPDDPRAAGDRV